VRNHIFKCPTDPETKREPGGWVSALRARATRMNAALPRDMLLQGVGSKGSTISVVRSVGSIERGKSLAENLCGDYAW